MKHKKNGFTLVELIVVLVILAVLAALLVPALTGYIDKARKSQVIAETRMLTQAAQTELSSLYATNEFAEQNKYAIFTVASKNDEPYTDASSKQELTGLKKRYDNIVSLSEVPSLTDGKGDFFIIADHAGKIQFTVFKDSKNYVGVYCEEDGSYGAYIDGSEIQFANGKDYIGKVVINNIYDRTGTKFWSKAMVASIHAGAHEGHAVTQIERVVLQQGIRVLGRAGILATGFLATVCAFPALASGNTTQLAIHSNQTTVETGKTVQLSLTIDATDQPILGVSFDMRIADGFQFSSLSAGSGIEQSELSYKLHRG